MENLIVADGVSAIVDEKMIVAIELKLIKAQHEPLQNRLRLEGDDAVEIGFVLRSQNSAVDFAIQLLQEMVLAQRRHVIYSTVIQSINM